MNFHIYSFLGHVFNSEILSLAQEMLVCVRIEDALPKAGALSVGEEVAFWPGSCRLVEVIVHVVKVNVVEEAFQLLVLLKQGLAPVSSLGQCLGAQDSISKRPDIISMGLSEVDENDLEV